VSDRLPQPTTVRSHPTFTQHWASERVRQRPQASRSKRAGPAQKPNLRRARRHKTPPHGPDWTLNPQVPGSSPGGAQAALFSRRGSTLNRERCLVRCRPTSRHRCHPQERLPPGGRNIRALRSRWHAVAAQSWPDRSSGAGASCSEPGRTYRLFVRLIDVRTGLLSLHLPLTVCSHLDP